MGEDAAFFLSLQQIALHVRLDSDTEDQEDTKSGASAAPFGVARHHFGKEVRLLGGRE